MKWLNDRILQSTSKFGKKDKIYLQKSIEKAECNEDIEIIH